MARRSEHSKDEIKSMILEAAENIVQEQGFSALKIRKISADMGYTVASVYMVFDNMDDLDTQIKSRTLLKMIAFINTQQSIEGKVNAYFDYAFKERGLWAMLFQHQSEKELLSVEELNEVQLLLEREFHDALCGLNAKKSPEEIKKASSTLLHAVQGLCMPLLMKGTADSQSIKGNIDLFLQCFLHGWRKL